MVIADFATRPGSQRYVELSGDSGISGDLWAGMMIGLGARADILERLPSLLGFDDVSATAEVGAETGATFVRVRVEGTQGAPRMHWSDMLSAIDRVGEPARVRDGARAVLRSRQAAEAEAMVMPLERSYTQKLWMRVKRKAAYLPG